jgi:Zn-dependent protease
MMRGQTYGYYPVTPQRAVSVQPPPYSGPRTSRTEIVDLTLAIIVLTIIFGLPSGGLAYLAGASSTLLVFLFGSSFIAVMFSIFSHELSHKFIAQRFGCWAEFRKSTIWLGLGLVSALAGFFFIAAPGAVMIAGPVTRESNGKISAAGPLSNAIMGFVFLPLAILTTGNLLLNYVLVRIVTVNGLLGLFNMIPFYPLDGSKVWKWSGGAFAGLVLLLLSLLFVAQMTLNILGL